MSLLTNKIIQTVKIKVFPNQKPWVDRAVRTAITAHTAAYNAELISGDVSEYKKAAYGLRKTVKSAKSRYKDRVEADFNAGDPAQIWNGLRVIMDFKSKPCSVSTAPSLADKLNAFYAQFETNGDNNSMAIADVNCVRRALFYNQQE